MAEATAGVDPAAALALPRGEIPAHVLAQALAAGRAAGQACEDAPEMSRKAAADRAASEAARQAALDALKQAMGAADDFLKGLLGLDPTLDGRDLDDAIDALRDAIARAKALGLDTSEAEAKLRELEELRRRNDRDRERRDAEDARRRARDDRRRRRQAKEADERARREADERRRLEDQAKEVRAAPLSLILPWPLFPSSPFLGLRGSPLRPSLAEDEAKGGHVSSDAQCPAPVAARPSSSLPWEARAPPPSDLSAPLSLCGAPRPARSPRCVCYAGA